MAFHWKSHNDIFKGPGIYHLTFAVSDRRPLLGELVPLEHSRAYSRAGLLSRSYIGGVERPLHIDENDRKHPLKYRCIQKVRAVTPIGYSPNV